MKKILAALLVCGSVSAFAQVGDAPTTNNVNKNIVNSFDNGLVQFNLIKDGSRSENQIRYISFANNNNKYLNKTLSNANLVYFATTIQEENPADDYGIRMFTYFDDKANIAYNRTQLVDLQHSQLSAGITPDEIKGINFKKALDQYSANYDSSKLVQVVIEKDHSKGMPLLIGFITADSDQDLANNDCRIKEFYVKSGKEAGGTSVYCRLF